MTCMTFDTKTNLSLVFLDESERISTRSEIVQKFFQSENVQSFISEFKLDLINPDLLFQAFCHCSFLNHFIPLQLSSNEKLELLGDSVLNLIVVERIFQLHSDLDEGQMSKLRAALVNEESLAELSREIGLEKLLLVGKGESQMNGFEKNGPMSDCLEAIIGAIYLSSSEQHRLENAKRFFSDVISSQGEQHFYRLEKLEWFDSKSSLQEWLWKEKQLAPLYHAQELRPGEFEVWITVNNVEVARARGDSKKKMEKLLAKQILENKTNILKRVNL